MGGGSRIDPATVRREGVPGTAGRAGGDGWGGERSLTQFFSPKAEGGGSPHLARAAATGPA